MAYLAPPAETLPAAPSDGSSTELTVIPIRIPTVAWIGVGLALLWIAYAFAGVHIFPNTWNHFHEFFHDGRHFLGIPCH